MSTNPKSDFDQRRQAAEDLLAKRLSNATSIGASDGALTNHRFTMRRIDAMEAQANAAAAEPADGESPPAPGQA